MRNWFVRKCLKPFLMRKWNEIVSLIGYFPWRNAIHSKWIISRISEVTENISNQNDQLIWRFIEVICVYINTSQALTENKTMWQIEIVTFSNTSWREQMFRTIYFLRWVKESDFEIVPLTHKIETMWKKSDCIFVYWLDFVKLTKVFHMWHGFEPDQKKNKYKTITVCILKHLWNIELFGWELSWV